MLSKSKLKLIKSLKNKKSRESLNLFLVEGLKGIIEVNNSSYDILFTLISRKAFDSNKAYLPSENIFIIEEEEIQKISNLKKNKIGLSVVKSKSDIFSNSKINGLMIALDSINDPGNLGTIIRNADWFGIKNIALSPECADPYNPKSIRAAMGTHFIVTLHMNTDLNIFKKTHRIIAADLSGENASAYDFPNKCVLVLGSEAHGISEQNLDYIEDFIFINKLGSGNSLNVSTAGSILIYLLMKN